MVLADVLAILDIVITVLIGFVITHVVSVRDSRTRAIKDYYIQELTGIKSEINEFYSKLFKGELEAQDIIGWYSGFRNRVDIFDHALRKTFTIYEAHIAKKLFYNHKFITNSDDFNSNYNQGKIRFNAATKVVIGRNQRQLYMLIEKTLYDINNVSVKDYISRKLQDLKSHYLYYKVSEKKIWWRACVNIVKDWLVSHKSNVIVLGLVLLIIILLFLSFKHVVKDEKVDSKQTELLKRLDSISVLIKEISENSKVSVMTAEAPSMYSIRMNEVTSTDTISIKGRIKVIK